MQNQRSDQAHDLTVIVMTPDSEPVKFGCDSLHLTVRDGRNGRGGGSYGIRRGHAKAVLSLGRGLLEAFDGGECTRRITCSAGFARIENDRVTVTVERAEEE